MHQLIDFYADWCGPCQVMKPVLAQIEKEYEGKLNVKEVDVEEDSQMASQFGVMSIPTFVVLKDGVEIGRKSGAMPKDMFKSWIDSNLK